MITKRTLSEQETVLVAKIDAKITPIQSELDALTAELQAATAVTDDIKDKIRAIKPSLVPLAEMKAGIASPGSRDKYFPDHSKTSFIEHVDKTLS